MLRWLSLQLLYGDTLSFHLQQPERWPLAFAQILRTAMSNPQLLITTWETSPQVVQILVGYVRTSFYHNKNNKNNKTTATTSSSSSCCASFDTSTSLIQQLDG